MSVTYTIIEAGYLSSEHVGQRIRYAKVQGAGTEIQTVSIVTTELRQIHHNGVDTILHCGYQADIEVCLTHTDVVILNPVRDYSDVMGKLLFGENLEPK